MKSRLPLAVLMVASLSGCSTFGGAVPDPCGRPGAYMDAEAREPLRIPDGLDRPPPQRRMAIPEGADVVHPELRGRMVQGEGGQSRCLDLPPGRRGLNY